MAELNDYPIEKILEMSLWERLSLYPWRVEILSIGFIFIYFLTFYFGSRYNRKLVDNFVDSILPTLKENFFQVGVTSKELVAQDDGQNFTLYATGRLRIESMITKIKLQARQNLFLWSMEYLISFFTDAVPVPQDLITIEFKYDEEASEKFDNFIWAIVTKSNMNDFRSSNYFLSLTKTAESPKLPIEFVFMNEVPEMNDVLFNKKLSDLLESNKSLLKYIAITDQQDEKPSTIAELKPCKKLIIQFSAPASKAAVESISNLVSYIVNDYLDSVVNKGTFRPELTRKIKKTRENEYNKLKKILDDEKKEVLNTKKLEEQKKVKASMTPEEQQKLAQRQKDRKQRKMLNRQKVRA